MYVKLYQKKNNDNKTRSYNSPCSVDDASTVHYEDHDGNNMDNDISRVKTGSDSWAWIYSGTKYTGQSSLIGPNREVELDTIGMENCVSSYILYDHNPNANPDCWVTLYDKDNYNKDNPTSDTLTLYGKGTYKLHDYGNFKDKASSLKLGSSTWAIIHNKKDPNDYGSTLFLTPNQEIPVLGDINQNIDGGTWENAIGSIQIFDTPQVDTDKVLNNFFNQYPNDVDHGEDVSKGAYFTYYTEGSEYKVRYPLFLNQSNGSKFEVTITTQRVRLNDEEAEIKFYINSDGDICDEISITYKMPGDVPDWVIRLVDGTVRIANDVLTVATDGMTALLENTLINMAMPGSLTTASPSSMLTLVVDHINFILNRFRRATEDGGITYFPLINVHVIMRLIFAFKEEVFGKNPSPITKIDTDLLASTLGGNWTNSVYNSGNKHMHYSNYANYKVWYPECSSLYSGVGVVCSCKVSTIIQNGKEDYLSLTAAFDANGNVVSIFGSILLFETAQERYIDSGVITYGKDEENGLIKPIKITQSEAGDRTITDLETDDLVAAFKDSLQNELDQVNIPGTSAGTPHFPDTAVQIINAWKASVYTTD